MSQPPPTKPPPLKIGEWPWWLESPYVVWLPYVVVMALRLYFDLLWGNFRRLVWHLVLYAVFFLLLLVVRGVLIRRQNSGPEEEPLPASVCPGCGYDVRATPLRCPECGADTPFKKWLDEHPLDQANYEMALRRKTKNDQAV